MSIRENLQKVEESIAKSAAVSGRKAEDVTLIAVSKTIDVERILEAYEAGVRQLGENRVQEMMGKQPQLPPDIGWHLIGQLQKNKVKYIIDKVKLVHSLCSLSVAQEMQRLLEKRDTALDCLIEINIAGEETKSGLSAQELPAFLEQIAPLDRVHIKGLMTVAPFAENPEEVRKYFAEMRGLFDKLSGRAGLEMKYLSMGMSGDYNVAIEEGANMVRVGTAIFGHRNYTI